MFNYLQVLWNYCLLEAKQPFQKCPIQTIFNKVIDAGYYTENGTHHYMCLALLDAELNKVITSDECKLAKAAITGYLAPTGQCTLTDALLYTRVHAHIFSARLKIYRNWGKRPKLEV